MEIVKTVLKLHSKLTKNKKYIFQSASIPNPKKWRLFSDQLLFNLSIHSSQINHPSYSEVSKECLIVNDMLNAHL